VALQRRQELHVVLLEINQSPDPLESVGLVDEHERTGAIVRLDEGIREVDGLAEHGGHLAHHGATDADDLVAVTSGAGVD
jgi:hypothetical protein